MAELFDGIPLEQVSTSMTINSTAIILLAMYVALAGRRNISPKALTGTVQNDILKEYVARGTYIYPPKTSLRLVSDIFGYCAYEVPQWNPISVSGYHIREAGSTAVQEVAFTLANGLAYLEAALKQVPALGADGIAQRMSFFFAAHNDFLEEIAKFRAARRLWARLVVERFGVTNPRAQQAVESGAATVVGVTRFQTDEAPSIPTLRIDPQIETTQKQRLQRVRARRDAARWKGALDQVRQAAAGEANLMPPIIAAVEA